MRVLHHSRVHESRVTADSTGRVIDASIPNNQNRFSVTTDNARAMFNELRYRCECVLAYN